MNVGNNLTTGGGGKDKFICQMPETSGGSSSTTITDFGGINKGSNRSPGVIAEVDTLQFTGSEQLTAKNLQLTQNGNNLEITFERTYGFKVVLQNFALENLDNLAQTGNILFNGQTSITDSFDVFNANSTQSTIFNLNTVTFLNDLNNNVNGFDNSDDVINGQGGNDIIDGKSGNDLLRGSVGNDTLIGGIGDDVLLENSDLTGDNLLSGGDGNDILSTSGTISGLDQDGNYLYSYVSGNNTLNGGAGDDNLGADISKGDNLLSGGDGNDFLSASGHYRYESSIYNVSGNNTLNGGAGNDTLNINYSVGNNLLSGDDGNDYLSASKGRDDFEGENFATSGNNTLDGGAGNDTLNVDYSKGDNLLFGGDGNDYFYVSGPMTQTVDGGKGDDLLSVNYYSTGTTSTFNATTNIGSITDRAGTNRVSYKNIERLNILGTRLDDNIVGSNGNDTLNGGYGGNDTIDGGIGDDLLSVDYSISYAIGYPPIGGITTTINANTNIGLITLGTNRVSYKNIERLNIFGTPFDDNIVGGNGNDTLSGGYGGNDTIDGGIGDDLLSVDYSHATGGIASSFNATTNIGSITAGTNQVSYKNIERLNILGTGLDDNIVGSNGNDTLSGGYGGNDTLTGGNGNDTFTFNLKGQGVDRVDDFNATNELIKILGYDNALSKGSLQKSQFTIGASATTSNQRFIYDSSTGGLYFDSDGIAAAFTQVKFAQLSSGLSLTNKNFVVV